MPDFFHITLPLVSPVHRFLLLLIVMLAAPILLNRLRIPHLLGLIIAGIVIGPNGLALIERDSSIILSGTAGLLYIMFLAGISIDLNQFRRNSGRSLVSAFFTFSIPMSLGMLAGHYVLQFSWLTSILLASMFASHTLLTFPLIRKLGVSQNRAVNVTVGGTMLSDTSALLVLAGVVGVATGNSGTEFWLSLGVSVLLFGLVVMTLFPALGRWFLKRYDDPVLQYVFVLAMVFLGGTLADAAGIQPIIGAFLTGLALNRLIPVTSPLMHRVEFVGNAIFIPFFLIGVGMLVDYRAFLKDMDTIKVAVVMTVVATVAKYLAAWSTQKALGFSLDERRLIFGLSNSQAAATLAAVLVGYNTVIGYTHNGMPIRLLGDTILNGTILMILVTCTLAAFVAQRGATNIALSDDAETDNDNETHEKILIPISKLDTTEELVHLALTVKSKRNRYGMYALTVVDNSQMDESADKKAKSILEKAAGTAGVTDHLVHELLRYDVNIANGILSAVRENKITDMVLALHNKKKMSDSFLGSVTEGILSRCNTTTMIYHATQPLATIKRHLVFVPPRAEREIGFPFWLIKVWNIAENTGARLVFYTTPETRKYLETIQSKHPVNLEVIEFSDWTDFLVLARDVQKDDNLIIVFSRKDRPSYHSSMARIPDYLHKYFQEYSYILVYPIQQLEVDAHTLDVNDPFLLYPIERLDEIGQTVINAFRKKS